MTTTASPVARSTPAVSATWWPKLRERLTRRNRGSPAVASAISLYVRSRLPLYAGFGISTPEQARAAAELADGIVVGTAALVAAEGGPQKLARYVASLRSALDAVAVPA